ncbi:DUF2273 domain-containing protein [Carnobacterium maltaromaticum]|uniref:DUF2273 domain-containing protein n=1 Tax=Carnobacterium maltaromaticum TaxID=2751 RepID=UPI001D869C32|nr:DUF2273 domain-containing protein [Carnobacterium maltaromaticum]MCC4312116.1 hypothetical protein [Carnobacterium maltaromaticum]
MKEWFEYYKIPIIFATIGLIIAILFITIGFFKTMLLLIFITLGGFLGLYLKKINFFDYFK